MIIFVLVIFALTQCLQSVAQEARGSPTGISQGTGSKIEIQIGSNVDNFFTAFRKSTEGINSSNISISRIYLADMNKYYDNYKKNLTKLNGQSSKYMTIDSNLDNIIKITGSIIEESNNNYYNYKIMRIYLVRKDAKNGSSYTSKYIGSIYNLLNLTGFLDSNASFIKTTIGKTGSMNDLDKGMDNIKYKIQKFITYLQNQSVGLDENYTVYNGTGIASYQQIYDYLIDKGQPIPVTLANYIEPATRIPTRLTITASNLSTHYNDMIVISGKLSYQNGSSIPDGRVALSFNNITFVCRTNESGAYLFNLGINGSINMNSYEISTSYGGNITQNAFLVSSRSPKLTLMLELENVYMTIYCPQRTVLMGDIVSIHGNLTAENGVPVAGANVSAFMEDPAIPDLKNYIVSIGMTDVNGFYQISYQIPDGMSPGDRVIYTAYTWPSTALIHAINSSTFQISVNPTKPVFTFNPMPLIYFSDDIIGIKGHLITPNGYNISGRRVDASLSGITFDSDVTDKRGVYTLSHVVAFEDRPGLQSLTLVTPGNGDNIMDNSVTVSTIIVLPYNKTIFLLLLTVLVLSETTVAIIASLVYNRWRRRRYPGDSRTEEKR